MINEYLGYRGEVRAQVSLRIVFVMLSSAVGLGS